MADFTSISSLLKRASNEEARDETRRPVGLAASREATLAQWLGEERVADVFSDCRPIQTIQPILDKILDTYANDDVALVLRLQEHWTELFGPAIASQCQPLSISGGVLKIEVSNSTCMYVFQRQQKAMFLAHLQKFTHGGLSDIQFVPRGIRRYNRQAGSSSSPSRS